MYAHCALSARGAVWIARNDKAQQFRIIPLQSTVGSALMRYYALDPDDPASWIYVENGYAYSSLDPFIRVGRRLGGAWKWLGILGLLPGPVLDAVYRVIARRRYRTFGSADLCALPDAEV
ncbi:MAG: DCC1-like thiol-disulfide oxidoreductase family protein [Pseudomonadota bacterium]